MLSKSRSHVLRLSAVLHVLFNHSNDGHIPEIVSEEAIRAAINFVQLSCEQTAIISGRGGIRDMILKCQTGKYNCLADSSISTYTWSNVLGLSLCGLLCTSVTLLRL